MVHDLIEMERRGVPTVALVSRGFEHDARATAEAFGMPDFPIAVVDRALTNLDPASILALADSVLEDVLAALTSTAGRDAGVGISGSDAALFKYGGVNLLVAADEFQEDFLRRGWGDGFPLCLPTAERVQAMLRGTRHAADEVVVTMWPGMTVASIEKIAINAVMAGCRPDHLPVLLAAVQAMNEPEYQLRMIACSTSPHAPFAMLNGPIVKELGINFGTGALGPGAQSRANTVIGRAIRLIMMNVGHAYVGQLDMDTIGSPLKYSMCMAENVAQSPWPALHVERGFAENDSVVTMFGAESLVEIVDMNNYEGEPVLKTIAGSATIAGLGSVYSTYHDSNAWLHNILLIAPDHARLIAQAGFDKNGIRNYMFKNARREWHWLGNSQGPDLAHIRDQWRLAASDPNTLVPVVRDPSYFHICVVGGPAGKSQYIGGVGVPVSRSIDQWR